MDLYKCFVFFLTVVVVAISIFIAFRGNNLKYNVKWLYFYLRRSTSKTSIIETLFPWTVNVNNVDIERVVDFTYPDPIFEPDFRQLSLEDAENRLISQLSLPISRGGLHMTESNRDKITAVIIPYRNRPVQLPIFLYNMHQFLIKQRTNYRIFIVEQDNQTKFNRGFLLNIGFLEAKKLTNFSSYIFHDIDMIPINLYNLYRSDLSPIHHSSAIESEYYILPYKKNFGGASSFNGAHFEQINGYSNMYWGWGAEDDDVYKRVQARLNLPINRFKLPVPKYRSILVNNTVGSKCEQKGQLLNSAVERMEYDGLNSADYHLDEIVDHALFTHIKVNLEKAAASIHL